MPKINTSLHADHQLDQLAGQFEHWRQTRSHPSERIPQGLDRHRDYAERYIDYYFSDEDSTSVDPFPQDMLVYIWVNSNYKCLFKNIFTCYRRFSGCAMLWHHR